MDISRRSFLKAGVGAGLAAMQLGMLASAEEVEKRVVAEGSGVRRRNLLFIMSDQHRGDDQQDNG